MPILGITASSRLSAAPTSYESIATVTVSSPQAKIEFTSIPSTYTHLQIRGILKSNRTGSDYTGYAWLKINGASGAKFHTLYGDGSTISAAAYTPDPGVGLLISAAGSTAAVNNMFGACVIDLLDYKDTNKNKTIRIFSGTDTNTTGGMTIFSSYLVNATTAITSITIGGADSTNLLQYSSLALYGIKGA